MLQNEYMWNHSSCDYECNKACKIDEYFDIKKCSCEKRLIGRLVLECQDEILNTTKTSCKKNNCLMHTISLLFICLLLLIVVFIGCYLYFTKHGLKQKHLLSYHNIRSQRPQIPKN